MAFSRFWVFTINNPTDEDVPVLSDDVEYVTWQRERGADGTEHYQGYAIFVTRKRLATIARLHWLRRAHLEPRRGSHQQALNYAHKQETRIQGPWEIGETSQQTGQGKRNDLKRACEAMRAGVLLDELAIEHDATRVKYPRGLKDLQNDLLKRSTPVWRNVTVTAIIGPTGTGKTRYAYQTYHPEAIHKLNQPAGRVWFDGYTNQPTLLIDDFSGWIPFRYFLNLLEGYPLSLEIKNGWTPALFNNVIITSNLEPDEWYPGVLRVDLDPMYRRITTIWHFPEDNPANQADHCDIDIDGIDTADAE